MAVLSQYDWIFALITVCFCVSAFSNGANDVANSYATSVAARTLTMLQVGFLSICTEFIGAVALGARVTQTIKNGIISIDRYNGRPGVLMLAMACAEFGSAAWLALATRLGMPVSTTHTIVGALVGVGIASGSPVTWQWKSGSVSQIAASWAIAPCLAAAFAALVFGSVKYLVLERKDPFKWALRLIPAYLAVTASILALFIVVEAPTAPSLEEFGAGKAVGIILGVFAGVIAISYAFFLPYFHRRLVENDTRIKWYHIPLGPTLWKDDPRIYFPSSSQVAVVDYYRNAYTNDVDADPAKSRSAESSLDGNVTGTATKEKDGNIVADIERNGNTAELPASKGKTVKQRFLEPAAHLPIYHPRRMWSLFLYGLLRGISQECVSHSSTRLHDIHSRTKRYDLKVEHLWTYAQVASAMLMSIAHGANDVANAVGPWSAAYETWQSGVAATRSDTPVWMLAVAGILLGLGFWFYGYHIIRSIGNRITQHSPTRGFSMEMGAAITVLLASRLGLPVSTTQCLTGATVGVALMGFDVKSVNWKQLAFIFMGWVITLPAAGLVSGLLMAMSLNTPHF